MFCPNCGAENDDDALFCGECGEPLGGYQENGGAQDTGSAGTFENSEGGLFCPNCGEPVEEGTMFCGNCGASINAAGYSGQYDTEPDEPPKQGFFNSTGGRVLTGALAVCAVFAVIIGGITLYNGRQSDSEATVAEESEALEAAEAAEPQVTQETEGIQQTEGVQEAEGVQGTEGVQGIEGIQGTEGAQGTEGGAQVEIIEGETQGTEGTTQTETVSSEYFVPDAATRYYTTAELSGLTKDQLRLARNEIYARHGRMFKDPELQSYFNSLSWYKGTIPADDFDDDKEFNKYEKANVETIKSLEKQ